MLCLHSRGKRTGVHMCLLPLQSGLHTRVHACAVRCISPVQVGAHLDARDCSWCVSGLYMSVVPLCRATSSCMCVAHVGDN